MSFETGDILRVSLYGFVIHEGVYTAEGTVISNSRCNDHVVEESVREFSGGRAITNIGALSGLWPHVAIAHARTRLGRKYRLFSDNCQHFVRRCYRVKVKSPQRDIAFGGAVLVAALMLVF